jgi:hypothetical protein
MAWYLVKHRYSFTFTVPRLGSIRLAQRAVWMLPFYNIGKIKSKAAPVLN